MRDLIKTDLRRILKDKLFLVVTILCAVFGVITPVLNKLIYSLVGMMDIADVAVSAKDMFFSSFSPSNNMGLIAPILLTIVICKDFSQGTVRNKLISGKTRTEVFMSTFISTVIVTVGVILLHALITLAFSLPFFKFQADAFGITDFFYILLSVFFPCHSPFCKFVSSIVGGFRTLRLS